MSLNKTFSQDSRQYRRETYDGIAGKPRTTIIPDVATVATSKLAFDAGASQFVFGVLITVNAANDDQAGQRLMDMSTAVNWIQPGIGEVVVMADAPITSVHAVGIGDVSANGVIDTAETTLATVKTAMTQFDFGSSDNVLTLSMFAIKPWTSASPLVDAGQELLFRIVGKSHA